MSRDALLATDFDFELPAERIAQRPVERGTSRLFVLDAEGPARHRRVADLPGLLAAGDLLVINDTRVIPARLLARRETGGGRIELLLVERRGAREWSCLARPGRKAKPGTRFEIEPVDGQGGGGIGGEVVDREGERFRIRFSEPIEPHLERLGHVPLPPYIRRSDDRADRERYQTVYARRPGAIAAPTAGLHFTEELLGEIGAAGIELATVTLHVGIGTFKPVTAERVGDHRMEAERWTVPADTVEAIRRARAAAGRVVAVGTTVVRTLEAAAREAVPSLLDDAYPARELAGSTELFITPGFDFRVVDCLLTNFHLPRSTLVMLVAALAGRERLLAAYREAIGEGYRFYSYGDAMWVERRDT